MLKQFFMLALLVAPLMPASAQVTDQRLNDQRPTSAQSQEVPDAAVAVLIPTAGNEARGVLLLQQVGDTVHIKGQVSHLTPGEHGFHIHQFGDMRAADGTSAGGHYAPDGSEHGSPQDQRHHAGDLGNITADQNGVAQVDVKSKDFKIHFVMGRALVVHEKADDFKSQPAGNAGGRVAIGVIGYANVDFATSGASAETR